MRGIVKLEFDLDYGHSLCRRNPERGLVVNQLRAGDVLHVVVAHVVAERPSDVL